MCLLAAPASSFAAGLTPQSNLSYSGGPVIKNPKIHVVYWGSNWSKAGEPTEVKEALNLFFNGVSGSGWQGILTQYYETWNTAGGYYSTLESISPTVEFDPQKDIYLDSSVTAPQNIDRVAIEGIIRKAALAKGWPASEANEKPEAVYVVAAAPGSTYDSEDSFMPPPKSFCGFHSISIAYRHPYMFLPSLVDDTNFTYCFSHFYNPEAQSIIASHEYAELVTDPYDETLPFDHPGWRAVAKDYDGSVAGYAEIGDLCMKQQPGQLENGAWVQPIRDNYNTKCSLSNPNPPVFSVDNTGVILGKPGQATLNAVIEPAGHPTEYSMKWEEVGQPRNLIPRTDVGNGTGPVQVSVPITGLEAGRSYRYMTYAYPVSDLQEGEETQVETIPIFFTPDWKPKVSTGSATLVKDGGATIAGSVNPNGYATSYEFEYGTTTAYGNSVPVSPQAVGSGSVPIAVSKRIEGLSADTVYHYRLSATNQEGTTYGEDRTLEIHAPRVEAESYPATLSGSQVSGKPISFGFTPNLSTSCTGASLSGALSGPGESTELGATYTGCTIFGLNGSINANGCTYVAHPQSVWTGRYGGPLDIACPAGKAIEFTTLTCTLTVGSQSGMQSVGLTDNPAAEPKPTVTAKFNASGLKYTVIKDGIGCPLSGTGSFEGATLIGSATVSAVDGAAKPIGYYVTGEEEAAHSPQFEAESYPATLSGTQVSGKSISFGFTPDLSTSCTGASLSGALSGPAESTELGASYTGCTIFGLNGSINANGCTYALHADSPSLGKYSGPFDINCPAGKAIEFTTLTCTLTIGAQSGVGSASLPSAIVAGREAIQADLSSSSLKFNVVKDGVGCPLSGTGSFEGATLTGTVSISANDSGGNPIGVRVDA